MRWGDCALPGHQQALRMLACCMLHWWHSSILMQSIIVEAPYPADVGPMLSTGSSLVQTALLDVHLSVLA